MLRRQIHLERGLLMENIIARVYELIKETHSLIEFEEQVQLFMHDTFSTVVGDVLTESNQRKISFRMKKRSMYWGREGAEAMVKVKQGIENKTLREVYLASQIRSYRKQRKMKQMVRMSSFFKKAEGPSFKVRQGSVSLYAAHSSVVGRSFKTFT